MNTNTNNTTLTVENEDFKVTIVDKLHTDLDVGNYCTLFRSALLALTFHPNNVDDWIRDEFDPEKIDRMYDDDDEQTAPIYYETTEDKIREDLSHDPCVGCLDNCEDCVYIQF